MSTLNLVTLKTTNITNSANTSAITTDNLIAGSCKAWVNFNGTGTVAIRASFNVSSITDNGVGDYTVNFTTAMQDANYSWALNSVDASQGVWATGTPVASSLRIRAATKNIGLSDAPNFVDPPYGTCQIFR